MNRLQSYLKGFLFLAALTGPGPAADTHNVYETLPGRKAMAEVPGRGADVYGVAHSQATDLAATQAALATCEANRPEGATALRGS